MAASRRCPCGNVPRAFLRSLRVSGTARREPHEESSCWWRWPIDLDAYCVPMVAGALNAALDDQGVTLVESLCILVCLPRPFTTTPTHAEPIRAMPVTITHKLVS